MNRSFHQDKYNKLREEYQFFAYENHVILKENGHLKLRFQFNLADKYQFEPQIEIPDWEELGAHQLTDEELDLLVFHIGMVELISYWKAACPPRVVVKPYKLNEEQIKWWKNIYFQGLGEYFYLNSIECSRDDFMHIEATTGREMQKIGAGLQNEVIVPVGGGKDSVVSLELLKRAGLPCHPMIMNPRGASLNTAMAAGYKKDNILTLKRSIHPQLLALNKLGFLNGHTPFSALLAFINVLLALQGGYKYIALSNESSADEPTVPDSEINHQYSKSYSFESDFRNYVKSYIHEEVQYFSFLRPLNELQIARFFSIFEAHHPVFRSCNVGSKQDIWCGKCPKCLFTYIMIAPYLSVQQMIDIYGHDLLDDKDHEINFEQLTGLQEVKPFECVGTVDEVIIALQSIMAKRDEQPYLLQKYGDKIQQVPAQPLSASIQQYNAENHLEERFQNIIKENISQYC